MNESDPLQTGEAASMELPPSARRMLRVVYIMGIVLVLLFLAFVAAIIWKANHKAPPKPEPPPQNLYLGLPPGAAITSASLDGDRLVITTAHEVIVVDVKKNAIISRIAAAP
jgi:flagellar basal body-associated protein FliL